MRSPEALKPRETHRTPNWPGAELSMETIRAYLADLSGRGRRKGTVQMYSAKLRALYDYLPPDKQPAFPGRSACPGERWLLGEHSCWRQGIPPAP